MWRQRYIPGVTCAQITPPSGSYRSQAPASSSALVRKPSSVPSSFTATSVSRNQRSLPCDIERWKSVRHSVHCTGRLSLRASRQHTTSCGCEVILLPNPPPMSCVTKRSLSSPTFIAGRIEVAPAVEPRPHEVPARVVVQPRGVRVLRRARVDDHLERLVVHLDEL